MDVARRSTASQPTSPSDWRPDGPSHSPAWRWLRARRLFETGARADPAIDDPWVLRARGFLTARCRAGVAPASRTAARRLDPPIVGAIALAGDQQALRRALLEAALLTEEPLDEVARRCERPVDVVEAYQALFFAVRERVHARDWISLRAVGCGPWNNFAGPQPAGLWKYAAFSGGARALDVVVAVSTDGPLPDWVRACWWEKDPEWHERRFRPEVKLELALLTARSPGEVERVVTLRNQLRRLDRGTGERRDERPPLLRLQEGFLRSMGRRRPGRKAPVMDPPAGQAPRAGAKPTGRRRHVIPRLPIEDY